MKNKEKQIAEYEELLKVLRSQLFDKNNKETVLTLAIKQVLDKWNYKTIKTKGINLSALR